MVSYFDNIVQEFESVRNSFYCPLIRGPEVLESENEVNAAAGLDWDDKTIKVDGKWLGSLFNESNGNLDNNALTVVRGMFAHEFGHFMIFPREAKMQTYLSYIALTNFHDEAEIFLSCYLDLANDIITVSAGYEADSIKEYIKYSIKSDLNPLTAFLGELYNRTLGLGIEINYKQAGINEDESNVIVKAAEEIYKKVDFFINDEYEANAMRFREFSEIAADMIKLLGRSLNQPWYIKLLKGAKKTLDYLKYFRQAAGGRPALLMPCDLKNRHGAERMEEMLHELCKELSKTEFDEFMKYIENSIYTDKGNSRELNESKDNDCTAGADNNFYTKKELGQTVDYYIRLAECYGVIVNKRKIPRLSCKKIMLKKRDFKTSDPPGSIDLRYSGGKLLPTLAKTKRRKLGADIIEKEAVPNLLIYKDVSRSMANPSKNKCFGTIAGAIFVLSYLRSGAKVGAAVFNSYQRNVFITANERDIVKKLCEFYGGGTEFDIKKMKEDIIEIEKYSFHLFNEPAFNKGGEGVLKRELKNCIGSGGMERLKKSEQGTGRLTDIIIISDSFILNLDEILLFVEMNPNIRMTFILTEDNSEYFSDIKFKNIQSRLTIYLAAEKKDIITFAHRVIKKNLIEN